MKISKNIQLSELATLIQKMITTGHTVETTVRKGSKIVMRMKFKIEGQSDSEVRIPCLVVPPSPFNTKEKA